MLEVFFKVQFLTHNLKCYKSCKRIFCPPLYRYTKAFHILHFFIHRTVSASTTWTKFHFSWQSSWESFLTSTWVDLIMEKINSVIKGIKKCTAIVLYFSMVISFIGYLLINVRMVAGPSGWCLAVHANWWS